MIRAAALASGDGEKLQAVLDAMYFGELPDFELSAVICPEKNAYVMQRALSAKVPAYVVDPDLFPTMTTHSMAVANKLKDMDIELVLLVDYDVWPSLCPAFEDCGDDVFEAVLRRGCKLTGATSFIADSDGRVGRIIDQRAVAVTPDDTAETLRRRVTEQAEWPLLAEAVKLYCAGKIR